MKPRKGTLKRGVGNSLNLLHFYEFAELYPLLYYVNKTPLKIIIVQKRNLGITSCSLPAQATDK